jgi:hypothetical protein
MNDKLQAIKWISTQEAMPKVGESVLVSKIEDDGEYDLYVAFLTENNHFYTIDGEISLSKINYWMQIPEPPQSEVVTEALAQIQRAKLNESAINGELPSIIDSLVDDE